MKQLNRWVYAVVGVVVLLLVGMVYAWSVMSKSIAGKLYDSTQSYMSVLIMLLGLILAGVVVFFGIRRPKAEV